MARWSAPVAILSGMAACSPCPDGPRGTDDPLAGEQWHVTAVNAVEALQLGGDVVRVAVIDNGVDATHEDLADAMWIHPGERAGNGVDDDGNGWVDDVHGVDVLHGGSDVQPVLGPASAAHGTAVAGLIAASAGNGKGGTGLCPPCRIVPIVARDFEQSNTVLPALEAAVDYAIAADVRVLVIADGQRPEDVDASLLGSVQRAVDRALAADIVVVASAGNDGDDTVRVPARLDGVLAVASTDCRGRPSDFTTRGSDVDLAAPGEALLTTVPGGYAELDGTSASAPIVAALAGLLRSSNPGWSAARTADHLTATAIPADADLGAGVVDFGSALRSTEDGSAR